MKITLVGPVLLLFALAISTSADRGSIPINPVVDIYEPVQRAVIAFNGEEEILILSTDLRASDSTEVLEVIPLPSEPTVSEGDRYTFHYLLDLVNEGLIGKYGFPKHRGGYNDAGEYNGSPGGEVTFHDTIGAHDITVTHALEPATFVGWVNSYLQSLGVENPEIPAELEAVIGDYLEEGYTWFVFDRVTLDRQTRSNDVIRYRFASDALYYPLKITRTETGRTQVQVFVISEDLMSDFEGIPMEDVRLRCDPVTISADRLFPFFPDLAEISTLFQPQDLLKLRIWEVEGDLSSFNGDLLAGRQAGN